MGNWGQLFLSVYDPDTLALITELDNGRSVNYLTPLAAEGELVLDAPGSGSVTLHGFDRDAYPLIRRGRILHLYIHSLLAGQDLFVGSFVSPGVTVNEPSSNDPTITIRGQDLLTTTQYRFIKQPSIAGRSYGTAAGISDTIIDLGAGASDVDDYYNGSLITVGEGGAATSATITDYNGDIHRATLGGWNNGVPAAGSDYVIYQGAAPDDLAQIVSHLPAGWTISQNGTTPGTHIAVNGQSVFDGLAQAAEQSGEHFRLALQDLPTRSIQWLTAPTPAPFTLVQGDHPMATLPSGAVIVDVKRHPPDVYATTRAYVFGAGSGADQLNLVGLDPAKISVPAGFSANLSLSLIVNTTAETGLSPHLVREEWLEFPHIRPDDDSDFAREAAQVQLFNAAIEQMQVNDPLKYTYTVTCICHQEPLPGMSVQMAFARVVNGEQIWAVNDTLYITRVRHYVPEDQNIRFTQLTLSETWHGDRSSPTQRTASIMRSTRDALRNLDASPMNTGGAPSVITGDLAAHAADPSAHHVRYSDAEADVRIALHAAIADAHHDPVTVGDGLALTDQHIDLLLLEPSGLQKSSLGLRLGAIAGDGLYQDVTNQLLHVDLATHSGLELSASKLRLGLPTSLSATSTNSINGNSHAHAISTTSNALATPGTILAGDAEGDLAVRYLGVNHGVLDGFLAVDADLRFIGAHTLDTSAGMLTLAPADDLQLAPGGGNIHTMTGTTVGGPGWISGFLGSQYGIQTDSGHADFRSLYAEELRVTAFIAEGAFIRAGSQWITPSMAELSRDFAVPAIDATATLYVRDTAGYPDLAVFQDNDWVLLRIIKRTSSDLVVANVWGQVAGYSDLAGGEQSWTFTCRSTADVGAMVHEGAPVLDFGRSGDGWIQSTTIDRAGSPYIRTGSWTGASPYDENNRQVHTQMGNLAGLGYGTRHGFYAGLSPRHDRVVINEDGIEIHNGTLRIYSDTAPAASLRLYNIALDDGFDATIYPNGDGTMSGVSRSDGLATYYSLVNEDPDGGIGSGYIYNDAASDATAWFALQTIDADLTALSMRCNVVVDDPLLVLGDAIIQLWAQVFQADGLTPLTEELLLATSNNGSVAKAVFSTVDTTQLQIVWDGALLRLRWQYRNPTGNEVIRLDPAVPSFAIGENPPDGPDSGGDGIWMGYNGGYWKFRAGGTQYTGLPRIVWTGTNLDIRNGATNDPVIRFDSSGNSYFAGLMTIDTAGEIRQGTGTWGTNFHGVRLFNDAGEGTFSAYAYGSQAVAINGDGLSIRTIDKFSAGSIDWYDTLPAINRKLSIGVEVDLGNAVAGYIETPLALTLNAESVSMREEGSYTSVASFSTTKALIETLLDVDRGTNDGLYLKLTSDVDQPFTNQIPVNAFAVLRKVNSDAGGLAIHGGTSSDTGVAIRGMAETPDTTTGTGAKGAVEINAHKHNGSGGLAALSAGENALVVRNNYGTQLIVKANGDLHINGTQSTYDSYDDVALCRALDQATRPDGLIRTEFDDFVAYRRADLQAAGILGEDGRMINFTQLARLHNGAIWQLQLRIQQLEDELAGLKGKTWDN